MALNVSVTDCLICLEPCTPFQRKNYTPCCRKVFHYRCRDSILRCNICDVRVDARLGCFYRSKCCGSVFHWDCKGDVQRNLPINNRRCPVCNFVRFGEDKLPVHIDEE